MVLSQTVMLAQVIPNMWGVQQGVIEGLSLLGHPTCPASWPASLVERVDGHPTPAQRATSVPPVTPVKSSSGKSSDQVSKSRNERRFWTSGMIWREREKRRSPTSGKKRSSAKNPVAAPSFP